LDDIVIVTSTFEEHLEWLKRILDKIFAYGLRTVNPENPEKFEFCYSQVYLGFIVQRDGLIVGPEKAWLILKYFAPRNLKLRKFLSMSFWYHRFIP